MQFTLPKLKLHVHNGARSEHRFASAVKEKKLTGHRR